MADNIAPNDIVLFEGNFADIIEDAFCSGCQYDMWLKDGTKVEFKSWKLDPTLQFTITKAINGQSTSFYPQFLTYLQTGKPQYNFNYHSSKGQSIDAVKGEFLRLFQSSKIDGIWDNGQSFFISIGINSKANLISDINTNGIASIAFDFIK